MSKIREEVKDVKKDNPLQCMKKSTRLTVDYFIDNPNVFRFFYTYEMDSHNKTAMESLDLEKSITFIFFPLLNGSADNKETI